MHGVIGTFMCQLGRRFLTRSQVLVERAAVPTAAAPPAPALIPHTCRLKSITLRVSNEHCCVGVQVLVERAAGNCGGADSGSVLMELGPGSQLRVSQVLGRG